MRQKITHSNSISLKGLIEFYEHLLEHNKIKKTETGAYKRYRFLKEWYAQIGNKYNILKGGSYVK